MKRPDIADTSRDHAAGHAFDDARLHLAKLTIEGHAHFRDTFQEIAEVVTRVLNIDRFGIWLLIDEGRAIRCFHLYQASKSEVYEGAILHQIDFPGYFNALLTKRVIPLNTDDCTDISDQLYDSYLKPLGITALLDAPLFRGGQVIGVVCHEHSGAERIWTSDEKTFAISVAEIISRLFEEADRKKAEVSVDSYQTHLMEIHRMEALGHLAAGVAHDFRNILTVILGQCEYIAETSNLPQTIHDAVSDIMDATKRGDALTTELLTFGREAPDAPQVLDLGKAIRRLEPILQLAAGRSVEITIDLKTPLSRVFIDPGQLERAVMNLVMNSRDAVSGNKGVICISLGDAKAAPDEHGEIGVYVCLSVKDNGIGMDKDMQAKIFDPFFSTKGDKGTGLGLAIVYQICAKAGGFIRVLSEPAHGATFNLYLPRIGAQA